MARLGFSRALCTVALANLTALVVLNALGWKSWCLLLVYPPALVGFGRLLFRAQVRPCPRPVPGILIVMAFAFWILLTSPRLLYLAEWMPATVVLAQADDPARLAELASLTLGGNYPLPHFANQGYLLSFYYAALYPMAFLKLALPFLTLKDVLVLGNAIYHLLILFSLVEFSHRTMPSPARSAVFLFLCTFFAGFDWAFYLGSSSRHIELWHAERFGYARQVSSSFTAMYWVVHHVFALCTLLAAALLARFLRFRRRVWKPLLLSWLLVSALYSSLWTLLPLPLVAARELRWLGRRLWRTGVWPLAVGAAVVPAFLFTRRVDSGSLWLSPVRYAFPGPEWLTIPLSGVTYLLLVSTIDLGCLPLWLLLRCRRFSPPERRWYAGAMAFFATTFVVESVGTNDYCMRGMFLPVVVFFALAARHLVVPPSNVWLRAGLALVLSLGCWSEWSRRSLAILETSTFYWCIRGQRPPAEVARFLRPRYRELARSGSRFYSPDEVDRRSVHKYDACKLIVDTPPGDMLVPERQLLRYPKRNWLW
ncbi:MAG: hypothetical protein ABSH44_05130 [Bryobacteraceae bacterium]